MKHKEKKDYTQILNNVDLIKGYMKHLQLKEYSDETVKNKLVILHPFFRFVEYKKAKDVTKDDVEYYILSLKKVKNQNTIHRYKIELNFFFKWLKPNNDFFSEIVTKKIDTDLKIEELITEDEAEKIIQNTRNQRDRAFIHVLYDSAARLSEIINMKKKDVFFDQYGGKIRVYGKTGERYIRIVNSAPDLQLWLNQYNGKPDDYLFPVLPEMTPFSKNGIRNILTSAAKRAGIKKKVYPHLFRHSKLTQMHVCGMTETELKPFAGWKKTSVMAAVYLHLSASDVDEKVLSISGIKKTEVKEKKINTIKICPRCQTTNPFDTVYCRNCSMILDQTKARNPMEEKMKELEDKIIILEKNKDKDGDLSQFF